MRYYIIAGEASGDLHGSDLVREIRSGDPDAHIRAWGGDLMQEAGAEVVKHFKDLAFMGFVEVVTHLGTILKNLSWCKKDIMDFEPDALIFIDYPGFNLRIARWAKKRGYRTFYYITPQIWAWNTGRAKGIRKSIDRLYAILPFEPDFYRNYDMEVLYVGHPLKKRIHNFKPDRSVVMDLESRDLPFIALLPGSRKQEIRKMLPLMLEAVAPMKGFGVALAMAPGIDVEFYREIIGEYRDLLPDLFMIPNRTYDLLSFASLAIVTSGTATLETALFEVPQVVVYKGTWLSFHIARRLIKVPYISLVNLILDRKVVPELIQTDCTPDKIRATLASLAPGEVERMRMIEEYQALGDLLGQGDAAKVTARDIISQITAS